MWRGARSSSQNTNKQRNFFPAFSLRCYSILTQFSRFFSSSQLRSEAVIWMTRLYFESRYLFIVCSLSPSHDARRLSFIDPEGNYNLYAFFFFAMPSNIAIAWNELLFESFVIPFLTFFLRFYSMPSMPLSCMYKQLKSILWHIFIRRNCHYCWCCCCSECFDCCYDACVILYVEWLSQPIHNNRKHMNMKFNERTRGDTRREKTRKIKIQI